MSGSPRNRKRLGLITAILLVAFGTSFYFIARPLPAAPPVGVAVPSPLGAMQTSSTQPKITWSASDVQPILSPGESSSSAVSFISSANLTNVTVEAVPEIAPFATIQPNTFASVSAGQTQSAQITFSIPQPTTLGTYDGTIHVRLGSSTLPQTLKVVVNVWNAFHDMNLGLAFKYPPFPQPTQIFVTHVSDGSMTHIDLQILDGTTQQFVSLVGLRIFSNSSSTSLQQWFEQNIDIDGILAANGTFQQKQLQNGSIALVLSAPLPDQYLQLSGPVEDAYMISPAGDRVVSITQSQLAQVSDFGYDSLTLLTQILGTMKFFQ